MAGFDPLPDDSKALNALRQAMLMRLAEIGMEIAEAAGDLARGGSDDDRADAALSYSRAARAVRLTLALQARLAKEAEGLAAAQAATRRNRIHRALETIIEREGGEAAEAEALSRAAWERLTDEDEDALLLRPIGEVVAAICRDLGLAPDWNAEAFLSSSPSGGGGPSQRVEGAAGRGGDGVQTARPAAPFPALWAGLPPEGEELGAKPP